MKNFGLLIAALFFSTAAHADLLTFKPTSPVVTEPKTGIAISAGATTAAKVDLITVGSALRAKVILAGSPTNIYVGELLVSDKDRYVKTVAGALPSLENEPTTALVLHFVYNVPTFLVTADFNAAVKANGIAANDADITKFMAVVSTLTFRNGTQFTMLFSQNADGTQTVSLETKGQVPSSPAPITLSGQGKHKILSMWLGKPNDDGLAAFQTDLMK